MTETQYILQLTLVALVSGAAFWVVAHWSAKRQLQPVIDEERKLRSQLELKRQEESQKAEEELEVLKNQLVAATTRCTSLEKALNDEKDAVTGLQAHLAQVQQTLRDSDAQTALFRARQTDLESALEAEKGRISAMQAALDAKQELAQQLALELNSTRLSVADERNAAAQRETALRASLSEYERQAASGLSSTEVVQAELDKAREALASLEQDTEQKQADLKRKLAAAEQKAQMLQKEIMALVSTGTPGDAAAAVTAAEDIAKAQERAVVAEKRVAELEAQLAQGDAGTRKRLREAEYRICELEFKLAQIDEPAPTPAPAKVAVEPAPAPAPAIEPVLMAEPTPVPAAEPEPVMEPTPAAPFIAPTTQPLVAMSEPVPASASPSETGTQPLTGL